MPTSFSEVVASNYTGSDLARLTHCEVHFWSFAQWLQYHMDLGGETDYSLSAKTDKTWTEAYLQTGNPELEPIDPSTIWNWRRGKKKPKLPTFERIIVALGITDPLQYLIGAMLAYGIAPPTFTVGQ